MGIKELIAKINKSVDELDLVTTRKYIEENLDVLQANRNLLKGNARELLQILTSNTESGYVPLTRAEMATISTINTYSAKFDVRSIKVTIKGKEQLILRKDFVDQLSADAKIILEGMGAIPK
ncbi:hypothetical protein [Bacillus sp. CECT 9360]|uniref:hypothetical protein n=1 Tax=Bacillus sp. CECT 9360 TaxID=2845821 RepID=UPI001E3FA2C5|nr:hypothetical protein [Bacillus sp. CECT 9360]CAH0345330.1 hypothetical protein BCI9360_01615 [Bacillus sp. CECT 9360]